MKKVFTSILCAAIVAANAFSMSVLAAEAGTPYGKVPATDTKITIDGKKDEIYDKGLSIKVDIPVATNKTESGTTATGKLLWNGTDTFYIYVEVKDKEVIKYEGTPNAWETDSIEIFFDYSNKLARTRDQYRIDVKNVATYYDTKTYTGDDTKAFGFTAWGASDVAGGYAVEFQIKAYNEPIKADMNIGFHIMINDMVKEGRNNFNSDACGNTPANFGYITLSGTKVAPDAPKTTTGTSSANTADIGLVLSTLSLAAASGVIFVLKKKK